MLLVRRTKNKNEHGGSLARGKRKRARPLCTKRTIHVVMRSARARGKWSMLLPHNLSAIEALVYYHAKKFEIRVHHFANVGNHIHLVIRGKTKESIRNFLRTVSGRIAVTVTGAVKGRNVEGLRQEKKRASAEKLPVPRETSDARKQSAGYAVRKFWDDLAYTRVVEWGRQFENIRFYITKNQYEGAGIVHDTTSGPRVFRIRSGKLVMDST